VFPGRVGQRVDVGSALPDGPPTSWLPLLAESRRFIRDFRSTLHGMTSRAQLERITDKLEQARAILDYSGAIERRLAAVRSLIRPYSRDDMPTDAARSLWSQLTEQMLRSGSGTATTQDLRDLSLQIHRLRQAIRGHLDKTAD